MKKDYLYLKIILNTRELSTDQSDQESLPDNYYNLKDRYYIEQYENSKGNIY